VVSYIDKTSIDVVVLSGQIGVNFKFYSGVFVTEDIAVPILSLVLLEGAHIFEMLISCQIPQKVVLSVDIVLNFYVIHQLLERLGCLVVRYRLFLKGQLFVSCKAYIGLRVSVRPVEFRFEFHCKVSVRSYLELKQPKLVLRFE
jgi:hypothetical protein